MCWVGPGVLAAIPLNWDLLIASGLLFGALLIGTLAIVWVKRWRKQLNESPPALFETADKYQALYDQGVMSKEEYDRIRTHLEKKPKPAQVEPAPLDPAPPPAENKS
jgi:hypothetical protein